MIVDEPPMLSVGVVMLVPVGEAIVRVRVELVSEKAAGVIVPFSEPVISIGEPLNTRGPTSVPALVNPSVLPFVTVVVPVNVFAPERISAPAPAFVMPNPAPAIGPRVRLFAPTVIVREPVNVTVDGPKSMLLLPGKVKSPPSV